MSIWAEQIFFLLLWGGGSQGWGQTWEDWEVSVIRVYDVKFPKKSIKKYYEKKADN